jgi:sugar/nucleoside kinase (ribokinase family)
MMKTGPDFIVMGDINLDWVGRRPLDFAFSELVSNGVITWGPVEELPGGSGLNFAWYACQAGFRPFLLGKVGSDPAGDFLVRWLEPLGMAGGVLRSDSAGTGKAFIVRDQADIRFLYNNDQNANADLNPTDVQGFAAQFQAIQALYISGYCAMHPSAPRLAAMQAAIQLARADPRRWIIYDVVPHQVYKLYSFEQFRALTAGVNLLISEVATMRRFLGLGDRSETLTPALVEAAIEGTAKVYPNFILRYGPSGCDHQVVWNESSGKLVWEDTGHAQAAEKRGFGDRIAIQALVDHFGFRSNHCPCP